MGRVRRAPIVMRRSTRASRATRTTATPPLPITIPGTASIRRSATRIPIRTGTRRSPTPSSSIAAARSGGIGAITIIGSAAAAIAEAASSAVLAKRGGNADPAGAGEPEWRPAPGTPDVRRWRAAASGTGPEDREDSADRRWAPADSQARAASAAHRSPHPEAGFAVRADRSAEDARSRHPRRQGDGDGADARERSAEGRSGVMIRLP